jgi:hypothetical protein
MRKDKKVSPPNGGLGFVEESKIISCHHFGGGVLQTSGLL